MNDHGQIDNDLILIRKILVLVILGMLANGVLWYIINVKGWYLI